MREGAAPQNPQHLPAHPAAQWSKHASRAPSHQINSFLRWRLWPGSCSGGLARGRGPGFSLSLQSRCVRRLLPGARGKRAGLGGPGLLRLELCSAAWDPSPPHTHSSGPHPAGHGLQYVLWEMVGGGDLPPGVRLRNVGHPAHWPGAPRCPGCALLPTLLGHPAAPPWPDWFGCPIQSHHPCQVRG